METESLWLWHSANKWKKMCQDSWHNNMSKRSVWFLHASDNLWCYFPHQMNLALIDELLNAFLRNFEAITLRVLNEWKKGPDWQHSFCVIFQFIFYIYMSRSNNCMHTACIAYRNNLCDSLVKEFGRWIKQTYQKDKIKFQDPFPSNIVYFDL